MRKLFIAIFLAVLLGCGKSTEEIISTPKLKPPGNSATPNYNPVDFSTDKAIYQPQEVVTFTIDNSSLPENVRVRYKHLDEVLEETTIPGANWNWQPPETDFQGYLAEVYALSDGMETIYATVGIDVSSDWAKFPRYGFLSKFSQMSDSEINAVIEKLNRYHLNGLQFYDWHNKHHQPLPINAGSPASSWKDIINRNIYFSTVERYIVSAHKRNMKAMFYNLINGAWNDAEKDGIKQDWYVYRDNRHISRDFHELPVPPFLSNIYLLDPSNSSWQSYLAAENAKVYEYLRFDGFHMDQLGDRGERYTYNGRSLDLAQTYKLFIEAMKKDMPEKNLVMNAVNQYGQQGIAQSSSDFLYTEVWAPHDSYNDLANIIQANNAYSGNSKSTVLAAYMNYELADKPGYFNTPGVLMTNAVIFAFGGAHLELGEHMLGKEYFPNNNLAMMPDLQSALVDYYDFLVAYQNLLRDGGVFNLSGVSSLDRKLPIENWPVKQGATAVVSKEVNNTQVIHLINFKDSPTLKWQDNQAAQTIPAMVKNAQLAVSCRKPVRKVWVASPDVAGGASRSLNFEQLEGLVVLTLPELKYWSMLVFEYE